MKICREQMAFKKKNANPVFSAVSQKYEEQNADVNYNKSNGSAYFLNVRKKIFTLRIFTGYGHLVSHM